MLEVDRNLGPEEVLWLLKLLALLRPPICQRVIADFKCYQVEYTELRLDRSLDQRDGLVLLLLTRLLEELENPRNPRNKLPKY